MITMAIDVHATIVGKEWSCKRMWMTKGLSRAPRQQLLKKPKPPDAQVFGYARVSTQDQKLDMQLEALRNAGVPDKNIYVEKVSGGSKKRRIFGKRKPDNKSVGGRPPAKRK